MAFKRRSLSLFMQGIIQRAPPSTTTADQANAALTYRAGASDSNSPASTRWTSTSKRVCTEYVCEDLLSDPTCIRGNTTWDVHALARIFHRNFAYQL
ncbi:hypothetical protein M0657_002210 [Pyricularia oryzae]|uniref:Uncharacterized protein n=1 Tax=Pyricularia oryzae TaxID=318829 RepID=A0A4P7N3A9_PYROR|nr:hypothetical protein M9X92_004151 [Pyricularia oryzae]KAI7929532.1 hypothetical protein M0657_002210 [Pyricularia oryzae]QBZ55972.1 hypothetical protein PoMZ_00878 [Pyricularia oryzae]